MEPKKQEPERIRCVMFVQHLSHFKFLPEKDKQLLADFIEKGETTLDPQLKKDIENSLKNILDKSGALEWAFICHDKDKNDDGKLKTIHYHVYIYFQHG